ncbi:MAG TPA: ATP-binding protein [Sphingopyxis sp.]|uniref:ATP-binding protein n=1 Tax=Sphingopyxis sp. TaxID=1908224 RepID=UPI002CDB1FF1|nr:ATP-binding protein [Sphingopyxis sp.]HWW59112.1 ATP-binding protein [Sphingopyxis sp.]
MLFEKRGFGLFGQIVAILFAAVLLESAASIFLYERASQFSINGDKARRLAEHLVLSGKLIEEAPRAQRDTVASELTTTRYHLVWQERLVNPPPVSPKLNQITKQIIDWEPEIRDRDLRLYLQSPGLHSTISGAIRLKDGSWVSFSARDHVRKLDLTLFRTLQTLVPAVALVLLASLLIRHTLRPMRDLTRAAETVGNRDFVDIPMRGPAEVRKVIDAFNDMQHRIAAMMADRTQALAAVGHDFRTPLARLRLRAESIGDPVAEAAMEQDIGEMERMIDSLLAYLSGDIDNPTEPVALTDIAVMCATAADEASDRGHPVRYVGPDHFVLSVHGIAIKRALLNLLGNALRFGTEIEVRMRSGGRWVEIEVADNGPGIPEGLREQAVQPFARLDSARARDTGGFGLGLSIVDRIARMHGGLLELGQSHLGGLAARVRLPAA